MDIIQSLKASDHAQTTSLLESITIGPEGKVQQGNVRPYPLVETVDHEMTDIHTSHENTNASQVVQESDHESMHITSDEEPDVSTFFSMDEQGDLSTFGPSSALRSTVQRTECISPYCSEHLRNALVAKAALSRQAEYGIYALSDLDGVPIDLAMHLLDLHWNRQHHTLLLTYRPVITRDILHQGPYASSFLLSAIFACTSKFSQRLEVRDDPSDPSTAGGRFFRRCDDLLMRESLFTKPSIPTIVGLLLLGSTLHAKGETSKGWLYTGYALRMVYDVGFHKVHKVTPENAEEMELRKRVFWAAFIWDKFQSLYLGRPIAMQLHDAHMSYHLMDTIEEKELFVPYQDPTFPNSTQLSKMVTPTPIYSVSCFQQLCKLSKLMAKIINKFYVVGATTASAEASLGHLDDSLTKWAAQLPVDFQFNPKTWVPGSQCPSPNVLNLLTTYHSLVILLHRPLVAEGHLQSAEGSASSWKKCTTSAGHITNIVSVHQTAYTLRGAPYLISYALYVACTIHVRNVAALEQNYPGENSRLLALSLQQLEELSVPNAGVLRPLKIIRKLMMTKGVTVPPQAKEATTLDIPENRGSFELGDAELDDVLRSFSYNSVPSYDVGQARNLNMSPIVGSGSGLPEDLLYGFMNDPGPMI